MGQDMTTRPISIPATQNRPGRAILLKVTAIFLFMVMAAMIKSATVEVPPGQAVFFRSFFALPIIFLWIWQRGELRQALVPNNLMGHVWRGVIGTSSMGLTFAGLSILPLPEVTAIGYATPIATVALAAIILGERIRIFRMSAVAMGLVGVMIVIWPRISVGADSITTAASLGAMMVLAASLLRALVQIHLRTLVKTEHTAAIVFYFSATASLLALFTIPFGWVWPSASVVGLLVGAGLVGGVAQILVTSSFRYAGASMLAPFDYTSMIFAAVIGYVVFAEVPTPSIWIGAALVIAGGILILWRERQLGLERGKARSLIDPKG